LGRAVGMTNQNRVLLFSTEIHGIPYRVFVRSPPNREIPRESIDRRCTTSIGDLRLGVSAVPRTGGAQSLREHKPRAVCGRFQHLSRDAGNSSEELRFAQFLLRRASKKKSEHHNQCTDTEPGHETTARPPNINIRCPCRQDDETSRSNLKCRLVTIDQGGQTSTVLHRQRDRTP